MIKENIKIRSFNFEWVDGVNGYSIGGYYQCRGDIHWNDEHDEIPDPLLWIAAMELEEKITDEGFLAQAEYSEKGWVEVIVYHRLWLR